MTQGAAQFIRFDKGCGTMTVMRRLFYLWWVLIPFGFVAACQPQAPVGSGFKRAIAPTPVTLAQQYLRQPDACTGQFAAHTLDFATGTRIRTLRTYESNGAGVAVNDLDADGDLDLVMASIDGESAILWNQGDLRFASEPLAARFTRGVNIVDVNGDGQQDIVFTQRGLASLSYWQNQGPTGTPRFVLTPLTGVTTYAYSMGWGDVNQDGALDLITGSYNIDLQQQGMENPEQDERAGIICYERAGETFTAHRLSGRSEALSVGLLDLDDDGQRDIWVANDFSLPDLVWRRNQPDWQQRREPEWLPTAPFAQTSYSTMSIDWGDLTNEGTVALYTTDMNPYDQAPQTLAAWLPVMDALAQSHPHIAGDPQIVANTLQVRNRQGEWQNQAAEWGIDATGWSWAGRFGDLDNDGFLDLYVVNGMIADNLFGHLPNSELVEENQAYRNLAGGGFAPTPAWGLSATPSGRGMVMADLDHDGDLDIVINNLRAAAQLFENQLCGGSGLEVDLRWRHSPNPYAIGAEVILYTDQGNYRRDVRASGGYLSGDPTRLHFGFPAQVQLQRLLIIWPDGAYSEINYGLTAHTLLEVIR